MQKVNGAEWPRYFLSLVLMAWNMQESLEHLEGSPQNKGKLKTAVHNLMPAIHKCIDEDMRMIYGIDRSGDCDKLIYIMLDDMRDTVQRMAGCPPEVWRVVSQTMGGVMDAYEADPVGFADVNEIVIPG